MMCRAAAGVLAAIHVVIFASANDSLTYSVDFSGNARVEKHDHKSSAASTEGAVKVPPVAEEAPMMRSQPIAEHVASNSHVGIVRGKPRSSMAETLSLQEEDELLSSDVTEMSDQVHMLGSQVRQAVEQVVKKTGASEAQDAALHAMVAEKSADDANAIAAMEGWRRRRRRRRSPGQHGSMGPKGAPGIPGPKGPQGPKGSTGPPGSPGPDGKCSLLDLGQQEGAEMIENAQVQESKTVAKLNQLRDEMAILSDMYERLDEDDSLGCDHSGPKGANGARGARGSPGPPGAKGDNGADGNQGKAGPPGKKGKCSLLEQMEQNDADKAKEERENKELERLAADISHVKASLADLTHTAERVAGSPGCPGAKGPSGDQGNSGRPGPPGDKGKGGAKGPPGPPGDDEKSTVTTTTKAATTAIAKSDAHGLNLRTAQLALIMFSFVFWQ